MAIDRIITVSIDGANLKPIKKEITIPAWISLIDIAEAIRPAAEGLLGAPDDMSQRTGQVILNLADALTACVTEQGRKNIL